MTFPQTCPRATMAMGLVFAWCLAAGASASVTLTDVTRFLFTTDSGNVVSQTDGLFNQSHSDPHGAASQNTTVSESQFAGVLRAEVDTSDPTENKQAVSQMVVEFTVTTPQLAELSVPLLTSEIGAPTPTVYTNGALLTLGDGLLTTSNYAEFLFDNGGSFGELTSPLDAFDSNAPVSGYSASYLLAPGDYVFGVQQVATAAEGASSVGFATTEFELAFTQIPEPATAAMLLLSLCGWGYGLLRSRV